jgi:hypothetical protein
MNCYSRFAIAIAGVIVHRDEGVAGQILPPRQLISLEFFTSTGLRFHIFRTRGSKNGSTLSEPGAREISAVLAPPQTFKVTRYRVPMRGLIASNDAALKNRPPFPTLLPTVATPNSLALEG